MGRVGLQVGLGRSVTGWAGVGRDGVGRGGWGGGGCLCCAILFGARRAAARCGAAQWDAIPAIPRQTRVALGRQRMLVSERDG